MFDFAEYYQGGFFKWNCKDFTNEADLQRFSGRNALKSGGKNQCLRIREAFAVLRMDCTVRDSRYRAAGALLRVIFCGLVGYRPVP